MMGVFCFRAVADEYDGEPVGTPQQDAGLVRGDPVVRAQLPWPRHAGLREKLPDRTRQRL